MLQSRNEHNGACLITPPIEWSLLSSQCGCLKAGEQARIQQDTDEEGIMRVLTSMEKLVNMH
jgi:hypothetical protein